MKKFVLATFMVIGLILVAQPMRGDPGGRVDFHFPKQSSALFRSQCSDTLSSPGHQFSYLSPFLSSWSRGGVVITLVHPIHRKRTRLADPQDDAVAARPAADWNGLRPRRQARRMRLL